jgi:hypothetical protein
MGAEATTRVAIIPDELSERVREQAVRATRGLGDKRLGGMSRTEASRTYLFQWTAGLWRVSWEYDHNRDQPTSLRPLSLPQATKLRPEGDHTRRSSGARTPGCTQSEAASGGPREELVQALPQHLKDTKHKKVSEQEAPDRAAGQLEATRATLKVQSRTSPRNPGMRWLRALLTELGERGPRWSVSKTSWRKRRRHPNRISLKMRFVHSSMRPPNRSVTSYWMRQRRGNTSFRCSADESVPAAPTAIRPAQMSRYSKIQTSSRTLQTHYRAWRVCVRTLQNSWLEGRPHGVRTVYVESLQATPCIRTMTPLRCW